MTLRHFYIVALWLPLLWPLLICIGELFLRQFMWHQMSQISGLILISGVFGGIQYLLFAAAISYYFANHDMDRVKRLTWILPGVFSIVCSIGLWLFFSMITMRASQTQVRASDTATPFDLVDVCTDVALASVLAGYTYVVMIHLVRIALEHFEYLEE